MKKFRVTVEEKVYDVLVELLDDGAAMPVARAPEAVAVAPVSSAAAAPVPVAVSPPPAATGSAAGDVPSPLAGKVVSIDVQVGQSVAEGAQLAVLEAMKMNTYLFAPRAGRVVAVLVKAGDGVEEGTPILRLG